MIKKLKHELGMMLAPTAAEGMNIQARSGPKALRPGGSPLNMRSVAVKFTILGSGSRGNAAYLETSTVRLLVDAGLSGRQIRQRLASIGRTPETLDGILLTHEHTDHTQGLCMIAAKLGIPIYCNRLTREAIESQYQARFECRTFQTGAGFELGDSRVETFSIPHDAHDPVGFLIRTSGGNVGFLTDLGHATRAVIDRVRCASVLVLETNYDVKMLQNDTRRPWSIKQRIASRHGHLSNDAAALAAEQIVNGTLRHVFLAHLSRDCNTPDLAYRALHGRLGQLGAHHVTLWTTDQRVPCPTLELGPSPRAIEV